VPEPRVARVYLSKLPEISKLVRVAIKWSLDLLFHETSSSW